MVELRKWIGKNLANKFSENDNLDQYDSNSEISDNSLIVSRQTKSKLEISLPSDFSQKSKIIRKAIFLKNIPERIARKTIGNFERTSLNQARRDLRPFQWPSQISLICQTRQRQCRPKERLESFPLFWQTGPSEPSSAF